MGLQRKPKKRRAVAMRAMASNKRLGQSAVRKGPTQDKAHLDHVRKEPCMVCSNEREIEAHHIRECYPRTMGRRIGDDKTIPLCRTCHAMLHRNSRTFWTHPDDVRQWAASLYAATLQERYGPTNPTRRHSNLLSKERPMTTGDDDLLTKAARMAVAQLRNGTLEEAAKVAEGWQMYIEPQDEAERGIDYAASQIAEAIRALKTPEPA